MSAPPAQSSTGSSMLLPVGEWMTVAESEQTQRGQYHSPRGAQLQGSTTRTEVQLRIQLR